jgi:NADPH:quinone reductase-like Zn-dependent oxidoreductase
MKAIVVTEYGGPEVLKFEDYPDPVPGPGEVLVQVAATSVNPIDYKRRAGLTKEYFWNRGEGWAGSGRLFRR